MDFCSRFFIGELQMVMVMGIKTDCVRMGVIKKAVSEILIDQPRSSSPVIEIGFSSYVYYFNPVLSQSV